MTAAPFGRRTAWTSVATTFIMVGAGLRLLGHFSQGQLYVDDARLALNIASRSLGDLTRPLDYGQVAPIPFLWIERLATRIGGVNEHALRAAPLLASMAVLVLLWRVGRRAFGEQPAALATCFGALSSFLIGYASAVKQYSSDALVTLVIFWLVLDVLSSSENHAAWVRLTIGGAAALWVSHPAVFVLAGATLALPASAAVRAVPKWWRRYSATALVWVGVFGAIYLLIYQTGERDSYLKGFWESTFLSPGAPDFAGRVYRAARATLVPVLVWPGGTLFGTPLFLGALTTVGCLAGVATIVRAQGASLALFCAVPYVAVLGAAMLGLYPPAERFLIFAAPLLLFVYASALCGVATVLPRRWRGPALTMVFVLATLWSYPAALEEGLHPERRRETKTLLGTVDARAPEAPVYLFTPRIACVCSIWAFYTTDWNAPDTARLRGFARTWTAPAGAEAMSFRAGRHQEIIGAAARIPYVSIARSPEPDPAWVERESERIRRAANPIAWLWATELYPENAIAGLLHGLRRRGGRLMFARRVLGATAWEVEFSNSIP